MIYYINEFFIKRILYICLLLFLLLFNIPTLLVWVILLPINKKKRNEIVYRCHVYIIKFVYRIFFTFEIINKEHYKNIFFKQQYLFCPNHQSEDIHLFQLSVYNYNITQTVILHSNFDRYIPIISWIWNILDHIFVQPKKTVEMATEHLLKNKHLSLALFPEVKKQYNLKFNENVKTGAFQISFNTGIPILPVCHNMGIGVNSKYACINYGKKIKFYIGDPIFPEGKSVEQLKEEYIQQMKTIESTYFT